MFIDRKIPFLGDQNGQCGNGFVVMCRNVQCGPPAFDLDVWDQQDLAVLVE